MKVYPERARLLLPQIGCNAKKRYNTPFMPDDHSELVPPLPIPNRTVKRLHANDSADTRVKVGNRQAPPSQPLKSSVPKPHPSWWGFCVWVSTT